MLQESEITMKNTTNLPTNYELKESFDLKDNKENIIIQSIFFIIAGIFVGSVFLFKLSLSSTLNGLVVALVTVALVLVYMTLHELTHGVFISLLSKTKSKYSFRFPFLTTGTAAYLNKTSFIIVCLAPSVVWGIILGIVMLFIPNDLRLSFYILLGLNFAGSAGDYLQVYLVRKFSKSTLIKDDGKTTNIYIEK